MVFLHHKCGYNGITFHCTILSLGHLLYIFWGEDLLLLLLLKVVEFFLRSSYIYNIRGYQITVDIQRLKKDNMLPYLASNTPCIVIGRLHIEASCVDPHSKEINALEGHLLNLIDNAIKFVICALRFLSINLHISCGPCTTSKLHKIRTSRGCLTFQRSENMPCTYINSKQAFRS